VFPAVYLAILTIALFFAASPKTLFFRVHAPNTLLEFLRMAAAGGESVVLGLPRSLFLLCRLHFFLRDSLISNFAALQFFHSATL
jgi:hypothetical protein